MTLILYIDPVTGRSRWVDSSDSRYAMKEKKNTVEVEVVKVVKKKKRGPRPKWKGVTCKHKSQNFDCQKPAEVKGLCRTCYQRKRHGLNMNRPHNRKKKNVGICKHKSPNFDCQRPAQTKGLCLACYSRYRRGLNTDKPHQKKTVAICKHESPNYNCQKPATTAGFCRVCYDRKKKGFDMDKPHRPKSKKSPEPKKKTFKTTAQEMRALYRDLYRKDSHWWALPDSIRGG